MTKTKFNTKVMKQISLLSPEKVCALIAGKIMFPLNGNLFLQLSHVGR